MNIRSFSSLYKFVFINRGLCCYSSLAATDRCLVSAKASSKPFIYNYLIERCGLSETEAFRACERLPNMKSPERPDAVLSILCRYGFTSAHIRDVVRIYPPVLAAKIGKYLVPQIKFLQGLGLGREDLANIVSKNPKLLTANLDQRLGPGVEYLQRSFSLGNKDVIMILKACKWFFYTDPSLRLLPNIAFLKNHGIVGTQLTIVLKNNPSLLVTTQLKIRELIEKVTDLGLSTDSRMFVYALLTMRCLSPENLQQKFDILRGYGLSEVELKTMFQRTPKLFKTSKEKLIRGMNFYLHEIGIDKSTLVQSPVCLMYGTEDRSIPRFKVLQILKSKKLIEKEPGLAYFMNLTGIDFVKYYISRFKDEANELLMAYKGESR